MQTDTLAQEKPSRENLWLAMLGIRLACVARTFSLYMTSSLLIPAISEGLDYQSHPSTVSNGRKSLVFSTSISFATRNCSRIPVRMNHRAAYLAQSGRIRICSSLSVPQRCIRSVLLYRGHCSITCCTVCVSHPHGHSGVTSGTWIDASQAFKPITSVRRRKRAVAWAFDRPSYSLRGSCSHGVFQTVAGRLLGSIPIAFSHLLRQASIPHLAMRGASPSAEGVVSARLWVPRAKDHMVFGRIYLSRYTLGFPRSSMVYVSTVPAPGKTFPAQVILCLLLKHTSPGLCCLGDTTFPSVMKGQVLSTSKVASSCLFVHRHARLSSRAM